MSKRKRTDSDVGTSKHQKKGKMVTSKQEVLLKQLAAREIKYTTFSQVPFAVVQLDVTNTPTFLANFAWGTSGSLCVVAKGDQNTQRTGSKIAINSIRVKLQMEWIPETNAASFAVPEPVRIVLALDKLANGAIPNANVDQYLYDNGGLTCFQSVDSFGKYKVLHDEVYQPGGQNYSGGAGIADFGGNIQIIKISHRFKKPLIVTYNNNASADIRQIVENNLFMMAWTNNLNQVGVTIAGRARIAFTDM